MNDFFINLLEGKRLVCVVGAGGKTSLIFHLAALCARRGKRTAVVTSTRIAKTKDFCSDLAGCMARWENGEYAVCAETAEAGKLAAPAPHVMEALLSCADIVLCESDGSRGLPIKAPAAHEPVILPRADLVIAVVGMLALGQTIAEVCHRPQQVCGLLGCEETHRLTTQDMAAILKSPRGSRKNVGNRPYCVVLNQCDDAERISAGREIARLLSEAGIGCTALTCMREGRIVWTD